LLEACDHWLGVVILIGAKRCKQVSERPGSTRFVEGPTGHFVAMSQRRGIAVLKTCHSMPIQSGLEVTAGYKAKRDTGHIQLCAHAATVAVDLSSARVEILDLSVVETVSPYQSDDCRRTDYGGCAQGIAPHFTKR